MKRIVVALFVAIILSGCGEQIASTSTKPRVLPTFTQAAAATPTSFTLVFVTGKPEAPVHLQATLAQPSVTTAPRWHIDAYHDETMIDPVNVWRSWSDRSLGTAGKVHHGDEVTVLGYESNYVQIRTGNGATGWLLKSFVR